MIENIIIIGNSVAANIVYSIISRIECFNIVAFAVNSEYINQKTLFNKPVYALETLAKKCPPNKYNLINAVGYNNINKGRASCFQQAKAQGYSFMNYIHPSATILSENIGEGIFIMPGVVIEPHATIHDNAVIWSNAVIAHHVSVGENCWIASGTVIAGHAIIGLNTFIGINATIVNQVNIGEYNIIGAGALISKNTAPYSVFLSRSGEKHRFDSSNYCKFNCF